MFFYLDDEATLTGRTAKKGAGGCGHGPVKG